jgi:hypothetical protein
MPKYRLTYQFKTPPKNVVSSEGDDYGKIANIAIALLESTWVEELHFVTLSDSSKIDENQIISHETIEEIHETEWN